MPKKKTSGDESPDNNVEAKAKRTSKKKDVVAATETVNDAEKITSDTDVPSDFTTDYGSNNDIQRRWKKRRSHQVV